jgi:hypothetical protein
LPEFRHLWAAYPSGDPEVVKKMIGGAVDAPWINNTCTIRLSRCFNYSGHPIPATDNDLNTIMGGDKLRYAFRVAEFKRYLKRVYGWATFTHAYEGGKGGDVPPEIMGKKGIIAFDVDGWSDATGHFDLWNGEAPAGHQYFNMAAQVYLWEAPDLSGFQIGASVGRGGVNKPDDVRTVQTLLNLNGVQAGPADGQCGPGTQNAILSFQRRFIPNPDGRIDVGGYTWSRLIEG